MEAALDLKSEVSPILTKRLTPLFWSHLWVKLEVNIQQFLETMKKKMIDKMNDRSLKKIV